MKTHNTLKKLLERFVVDLNKQLQDPNLKLDIDKLIQDYISSNSLALGKQKPLAKNKQTRKVCGCGAPLVIDVTGETYCVNTLCRCT